MKVLVTGAKGQLGQDILRLLESQSGSFWIWSRGIRYYRRKTSA